MLQYISSRRLGKGIRKKEIPGTRPASQPDRLLWRPFWIRRGTIACFLVTFMTMIAALETIHQWSSRHQGLVTTRDAYRYLSKYGPTLLLTLITALWNRVDYRIRQMVPLQRFLHGTSRPDRLDYVSVDYISPLLPQILWYSLRRRDFVITASSLIAVLLTLTMVASTGLLAPLKAPITITEVPYIVSTQYLTNMTYIYLTLSLPVQLIDAIQANNLSYPDGTTPNVTYQKFQPMEAMSDGSLYEAKVETLSVNPCCEEAELTVHTMEFSWPQDCSSSSQNPGLELDLSVEVNDCRVGLGQMQVPLDYGFDGMEQYFAVLDIISCDESSEQELRLIAVVGQVEQHGNVPDPRPFNGNCTNLPRAKAEIMRSRQWICKVDIVSQVGYISSNASNSEPRPLPHISFGADANARVLPNMVSQELLDAYWRAMLYSIPRRTTILPLNLSVSQPNGAPCMGPVWTLQKAPDATADELLSTNLYLELASESFKQITTQILNLYMTTSDGRVIHGNATVIQTRLCVREVSLRVMEGTLIFVAFLTILVLSLTENPLHLSADPANLRGIAKLIQAIKADNLASENTIPLFTNMGMFVRRRCKASRSRRDDDDSAATGEDQIKFGTEGFTALRQDPSAPIVAKAAWWTLIVCHTSIRILAFTLVATLIVALQVLLKISGNHDGLADITISSNQQLLWTLIPAAVVTALALYVRALSSVYKTIAPYNILRKGSSANETLLLNYLSMTEVETIFHSSRFGHLAILSLAIASMLSSTLTAVISRCFVAKQVGIPRMHATSWFDDALNFTYDQDSMNAGVVTNLILTSNLSYPDWTWQDLAFGSYEIEPSDTDLAVHSGSEIAVTLPALRAQLECRFQEKCDVVEGDSCESRSSNGSTWLEGAHFDGCGGWPVNQNAVQEDETGMYWVGYNGDNQNRQCPAIAYYWGYSLRVGNGARTGDWDPTHAYGLSCEETIVQVLVDVILTLPDLRINTEQPPQIRNSSQSIFSTARRPWAYKDLPRMRFPQDGFWGILLVKYGFHASDFTDLEKLDDIAHAIKNTHGIVRAQQYDTQLRQQNASITQHNTVGGDITMPQRHRLVQDTVSTHLLCAFLILILLCITLTGCLTSTRYVVHESPSTIGFMIGLLYESNVLTCNGIFEPGGALGDAKLSDQLSKEDVIFKLEWIPSQEHTEQETYTIWATWKS